MTLKKTYCIQLSQNKDKIFLYLCGHFVHGFLYNLSSSLTTQQKFHKTVIALEEHCLTLHQTFLVGLDCFSLGSSFTQNC